MNLRAVVAGSSDIPLWTLSGPGSLSGDSGTDVQYLPPDIESLDDPSAATVTVSLGSALTKQVQIALTPAVVPGHHWAVARETPPRFSSVASGGGRYVAVSPSAGFFGSIDGTTWTKTFAPAEMFYRVVWGGAGWVALASNQTIATSADGQAWTVREQKLPSNSQSLKLLSGNGSYLAFEPSGDALTSSDGLSWASAGKSFTDVAFGNGQFIGVVDHAVPYRSTDGLGWTATTDPGRLSQLAFAGGVFSAYDVPNMWQSSTGNTWVGNAQEALLGTLAGAGAALFELGVDELGVQIVGQAWQKGVLDNHLALPQQVAFGGSGYIGVNSEGWLSRSSDAVNWSTVLEGSYGDFSAVDYSDGTYFTASTKGWMLQSTDGQTWEALAMGPQVLGRPTVNVRSLAHGGGVRVATGCINQSTTWPCHFDAGFAGMWMRSTDGVNWTHALTPAPSELIGGVIHDGNRFVAVSSAGNVYASTDGNAWSQIGSVGGAPFLTGLALGGGKYVAVGKAGAIAHSADGITWTRSPGIPGTDVQGNAASKQLTGVTWSGSQFVGVGPNATRATSPDGSVWTANASVGTTAAAVTSCDGVLVSVGGAWIDSSIDGISWRGRLTTNDHELYGVACGGGRFVAVGRAGGILVSDH